LDSSMLFGIVGLVAGAILVALVAWLRAKQAQAQSDAAKNSAGRIIDEARKDAAAIKKDAELHAKDSILRERAEFDKEVRETKRELQTQEKRLIGKEEGIDKRIESLDRREGDLLRREQSLKSREKNIDEKTAECDREVAETRRQLERVAGLTREEAKKTLIDQMVDEAKHEAAKRLRLIEEETKEDAVRKSQKIVALAIERLAGDFVAERSVTVFPLPNDELKGKIIGREGRNIRALEAATGIDLIVDDTPETVVISGHNPIRREIARLSLEKLVTDGRIHPGRIEEVVQLLHLGPVLTQSIETLSKGFKRRVGLAQAILHDPDVLILDEPTDGLDPNQKHEVRELIRSMSKQKLIVISTHILEEVSAVCTRAIIITKGRVVFDGKPEELESQAPSSVTKNRLDWVFRKLTGGEKAPEPELSPVGGHA